MNPPLRPTQFPADILEAERLVQAGQGMPPRIWAAHVASETAKIRPPGLYTYEVAWRYGANGVQEIAGFGTTLEFERVFGPDGAYLGLRETGKRLNYHRPSRIAADLARLWNTPAELWNAAQLMEAIMLLDDPQQREFALEGTGMLAKPERFVPPDLGEIKRAARDIGNPLPTPLRLVMTEPREVFEAELERMRGSQPHRTA